MPDIGNLRYNLLVVALMPTPHNFTFRKKIQEDTNFKNN